MERPVATSGWQLGELLTPERRGDAFVLPPTGRKPGHVYGGQLLGRALRAACAAAPDDRAPHHLHALFLRPAAREQETHIEVVASRDGRSLSTRVLLVSQAGRDVVHVTTSFRPRAAGDGAPAAPPTQRSDDLVPTAVPKAWAWAMTPFEVRAVAGSPPGLHPTWLRATSPLGDDLGLHAAVVAYLSDYGMGEAIAGSAVPVGGATVSHALWFHRVPRADDWIRLDVMPATAPGVSPGLAHGTFRGPDGAVAVSFAQEVLFR